MPAKIASARALSAIRIQDCHSGRSVAQTRNPEQTAVWLDSRLRGQVSVRINRKRLIDPDFDFGQVVGAGHAREKLQIIPCQLTGDSYLNQ